MANKKDGFTININELKDLDSHLSGQVSLSEILNKEIKKFMFPKFNDYINQHESNIDKILGYNAISSINNIEDITGSIVLEMADLTNIFGKDSFQLNVSRALSFLVLMLSQDTFRIIRTN